MKFLSEQSLYEVIETRPDSVKVKHLTSGKELILTKDYLKENCVSDVFTTQLKTNITNLRNKLQGIPPGEVFAAGFMTKPRERSEGSILQAKREYREALAVSLENNMTGDIENLFEQLLENPILDHFPGEERHIVAVKTGNMGHGGLYEVFDLEKKGVRFINPQTLFYLVTKGTKYVK